MKSRMDRYCSSDNTENNNYRRTSKNETLYKKSDYNYDVFSSNETLIDTSNEVDITKIKNIIKNREDYQRAKSYRNMLNDKSFNYDDVIEERQQTEEKTYDINEILEAIKENKDSNDKDKIRKLKNTQYDILKKLDIKNKNSNDGENLEELINTITSKDSEFNLTDSDNDLLSDLIPDNSENTILTESIDKEETISKKQIQEIKNDKLQAVDDFYSDSFTFSKKDFEGIKNLENSVKSNNTLIKVLIFILIVILLAIALFIVDIFFDIIPFI